MIAGALLYFQLRAEPPGWIGIAACGCGIAALIALRSRGHLLGSGLAACALAAALGFTSGQAATWRMPPMPALPRHLAEVSGVVRQVDILPHGRRVRIRAVRLTTDGPVLNRDIRVRLRDTDTSPIAVDDRIALRALLRPPSVPAFPGGWDLQRDAFFGNLAGSGWAVGPVQVTSLASGNRVGWKQSLRERIAARFLSGMPAPEGAIAATLFTGTAAAIPVGDRAAFRDSGLAHILAVAGLHIGIVMGLGFGAARVLLALSERASLHWPCKQIAGMVSLGIGAVYMLLTGAHVPIIRSFVMASLLVLAMLTGRRAFSLRSLALAAAVLIAIAPYEVAGVSFQMSFAAVMALIAGHQAARPLMRWMRSGETAHRRVLAHGAELALTSALAGAASLPFGAFHFGHVQSYFIVANLIAVPLTAMLVMPAGIIALLLMPFGCEAIALWPMRQGIAAMLAIGHAVQGWPGAVMPVPPVPGWGLLLAALGLCWICLWASRLRWAGLAVLAAGLASPWIVQPPDVLISADTKLVAVRTPEGLAVERMPGASKFTLQSWRETMGDDRNFALPSLGAGTAYNCYPGGCRLGSTTAPQILLVRQDEDRTCTGIGLVVLADQTHKTCKTIRNVGWLATRRNGSAAVWLTQDGPKIVFDRDIRGVRPWVLLTKQIGRVN